MPVALLEGDDGVLDWDDSASWDDGIGARRDIGVAQPRRRRRADGDARAAPAGPVQGPVGDRPGHDGDPLVLQRARAGHAAGRAAPGPCVTCGFLTPLAGPLGRVFGVCANEYAPDDGRVVSFDHGCGAHSEAIDGRPGSGTIAPVIDEVGYDLVDMPGVALADTVFETLDHAPDPVATGSAMPAMPPLPAVSRLPGLGLPAVRLRAPATLEMRHVDQAEQAEGESPTATQIHQRSAAAS